MKKIVVGTFLALSLLGSSLQVQGAAQPITVIYNNTPMKLDKAPLVRHGKVWLPVRAILENMNCSVSYDKKYNLVCITSKDTETQIIVVKAGSTGDDGNSAILLQDTVYLPIRDIADYLEKQIQWDSATKTVIISNDLIVPTEDEQAALTYNRETGDFYDEKLLIANLPFAHLDVLGATKQKTIHNHTLYTLYNSYGEPHINHELYSIYVVGDDIHIAKSFKRNSNGENSNIQDNRVTLMDQNTISIYDDATGELIKRHTISTQPLKDYLKEQYNPEYREEIFSNASMGYMIEAVGEGFVLYRNYELKLLTLVNLETDQEIELYKAVYNKDEIEVIEKGMREQGDLLQFVKSEKDTLYLRSAYTGQTYRYSYKA